MVNNILFPPFVLRWAKVDGGAIVRGDANLPLFDEDFPLSYTLEILAGNSTVVAMTEENAGNFGWVPVQNTEPPSFDPETQTITSPPVLTITDGVVSADWQLRNLGE